MKTINQLAVSVILSGLIVLISNLFYSIGGELFLGPGILIEAFTNLFITMIATSGEEYFSLPDNCDILGNLLFYTLLIFPIFKVLSLKIIKSNV